MFHVDRFSSTITERGRSKVVEDYEPNAKTIEVGEALLVFASVEKEDEPSPDKISEKAVNEITKLANQLKVRIIVLHPFAHLFAEVSSPEVALKTLKYMEEELRQRSFNVIRTPFGWFNTLEIKAKGHPLSRMARTISLEE